MNLLHLKRGLTVVMILIALFWTMNAHATTPANWKDSGFSINAEGMTLHEVLNEFGLAFSVRVSSSVKDNVLMHGRLKAESGSEFLDRLTQTYKFRWFVFNDTLYVVPRSDNTSMRMEIGEDAVQDAKSALVGMGLYDTRFGWGELPDDGIVMVSGPREYVRLAREILLPQKGAKKEIRGRQLMLFRLKYASAADRVITTRGEKETIPGVKSILTNLLSSEQSGGERSKFDAASEKHSREPKKGRGGAREVSGNVGMTRAQSQNDGEEGGDDRSVKGKPVAHEGAPRIDADPALNAIIIYDDGSKRDMYAALIADLDIEPQQIEIEALIVDIDRSKMKEMGVEWGAKSGNTTSRINATESDSQGVSLPLPGSTLLISNAARFYARLKAMEGSGDAHVLGKPTVLTLDNVAAVLDLSQTAYVPLVGERVAELADVTAGTKLRVVPRIVHEGSNVRVRLEIDIEDGALGDPNLKTAVTRSTISTQAIIDVQQTLMIGGYHSESVSNNRQKVPLLGDAPLLGGLFRSNSDSHIDRERMFLITPRLTGTSGMTAPERSKLSNIAQGVTQENIKEVEHSPATVEPLRERVAMRLPEGVGMSLHLIGSSALSDASGNHASDAALASVSRRELAPAATPVIAPSPPVVILSTPPQGNLPVNLPDRARTTVAASPVKTVAASSAAAQNMRMEKVDTIASMAEQRPPKLKCVRLKKERNALSVVSVPEQASILD